MEIIQRIAAKTGRSCNLTLEQLEEEGEIKGRQESLVRTTGRQIKVRHPCREDLFVLMVESVQYQKTNVCYRMSILFVAAYWSCMPHTAKLMMDADNRPIRYIVLSDHTT